MDKYELDRLTCIEAIQSQLHPVIKQCIEEYGRGHTKSALVWFINCLNSQMISEWYENTYEKSA